MKKLLKELSESYAISGAENAVAKIVTRELKKCCTSVRTDDLGNVIATKKGKGPKIMLAAHMDEIGMMVKHIDKDGYLKFAKVGGIDDRTLFGRRVLIHNKKKIYGVIAGRPYHFIRAEEEKAMKVPKHTDLFIDIGAKDKAAAEKLVAIGDCITFDIPFVELTGTKVTGKSLDNRAGVAVMIRAMQLTKTKHEIIAVGTVQEEVGLKGARTSAFEIDPDLALSVDTGFAGDNPGVKEEEVSAKLGGGPAIVLLDGAGRGLIADERISNWLESSAKKAKIPFQPEVSEAGTTDATIIQLNRSGVRTGSIGLPGRYLHSPVEVFDMKDLELAAKLLAKALENPPK